MLSRWKSPLLLERKRRRYTTALVRVLYRRSGFNALPMIALGFLGLILLGSVLLTLPVASATGKRVPWFDTLFTSTSAVCVTGLVVRDTGTAYSTFGHAVLLCLTPLFAALFISWLARYIRTGDRALTRAENAAVIASSVLLAIWSVVRNLPLLPAGLS